MLRIKNPEQEAPIEPEIEEEAPVDPEAEAELGMPTGRYSMDKVDPSIAVYMGPEMGPFMCGGCSFFEAPNACGLVSGDISPDGCCNLFTPGSSGSEGLPMEEAVSVEPAVEDEIPLEEPIPGA